MVITFPFIDEDGTETEVSIPARYEVCDRCRGEGHHTNPAIDGNGITASEMDELGDDFREDYLAGAYDVPCEECHGKRVVLVADEHRAHPEILALYHSHLQEEADYRRECAQERKYGA